METKFHIYHKYCFNNYFSITGNKAPLINVIELYTAKSTLSEVEIKGFLTENLHEFRRFAYSLTNNTHDADDLLQTVFERILSKSIPTDVQPRAWVFRVCRNAWIDEIRSRKVRQAPVGEEEIEIEDWSDETRPSSQIHQIELNRAIEQLAEPYRTVISLVIIAGLSYAETAASLDIPVGTVMSRVARARQQLLDRLGNDDGS